jgi:hypothetical protein
VRLTSYKKADTENGKKRNSLANKVRSKFSCVKSFELSGRPCPTNKIKSASCCVSCSQRKRNVCSEWDLKSCDHNILSAGPALPLTCLSCFNLLARIEPA